MILLDTDIVTLYLVGQPRVVERVRAAEEVPVISVISRIEVRQGRFDSVLKAADGNQLLRMQDRLHLAERGLASFALVAVSADSAVAFDALRQHRNLRKIGRADLLIASIALASGATLVTRNVKHFRQIPGLKVENWAD